MREVVRLPCREDHRCPHLADRVVRARDRVRAGHAATRTRSTSTIGTRSATSSWLHDHDFGVPEHQVGGFWPHAFGVNLV
jgi:hypothetical protein